MEVHGYVYIVIFFLRILILLCSTLTYLQCLKDCKQDIWKSPMTDIPFDEVKYCIADEYFGSYYSIGNF